MRGSGLLGIEAPRKVQGRHLRALTAGRSLLIGKLDHKLLVGPGRAAVEGADGGQRLHGQAAGSTGVRGQKGGSKGAQPLTALEPVRLQSVLWHGPMFHRRASKALPRQAPQERQIESRQGFAAAHE
jgi:hypothetical protein